MQQKFDQEDLDKISISEAKKLIEELNLYQIELEMQNEQLREVSEELVTAVSKYEDLYDFAPVGYVTLDEFGLILEANLTCARMLGTERRSLLNTPFSRFAAPEHFKTFSDFLEKLLGSESRETCKLTFLLPDNTVLEVRLEGIASMARLPKRMQCRIAIIDISEQIIAERKAQESQEFVQKIADTMPDILTVYDLDTHKNVYGNRVIQTLLGISPEKMLAMNPQQFLELVHPEDLTSYMNSMEATRWLHNGEVSEFEYRVRNASGGFSWMRVRSVVFQRSANGFVNQTLSVQQDITYKKEAEEELRFKDQIISGLQTNLPIVISLIRPDGTLEAMSGSGVLSLEKAGIPDLEGQNIYELFPDLRPKLESVFQTGEKVSFIYCVGENKTTCFQNYVFLDPTQNAAVSFSIDISEQMAVESEISAEREFSQSLLDNSVDGILAFDNEMRFTAWNKIMELNTKLPKESVLGRKMFDLFPAFKNTRAGKAVEKVLLGKRIILYDENFGQNFTDYEVYLNPLINELGNVTGSMCVLHDVKARKIQEAETTKLKLDQQKAILNTILATQEDERRRIAESLHNGVGQLLYAAKLNLERNTGDPKESRKLLTELMDEAIRETRTISFELMPRILEDFGLETALQELVKRIYHPQLKLCLRVNRIERFRPEVEIAAYRIIQELLNNIIKHAKATEATIEITQNQDLIQIMVKDNGIGFNLPEVKIQHKGIGLSGIHNRVKLLDGTLQIESEKGKGTTVSIQLSTT